MHTQSNKRAALGSINADADSVEIGDVFGGLTLLEKLGFDWLMQCACKEKVNIKRSQILSGKRISCGAGCKRRVALRRENKKGGAIAGVYLIMPEFREVETRQHPSGASWTIFRGKVAERLT